MSEIIKINPIETGAEKEKREIAELNSFPDSVRALFNKLPDSLKNRIFPEGQKGENISSPEGRERSLEEIVASFDTKTREEFMMRCVSEIFDNGKFKDGFEAVGDEDLKQEIERLLNLLWQNRGKRDDVQLFNQEYYDNFFQARGIITEKIKARKLEIDKLNGSIANTIKQRRLTEKKRVELRKLESELNLLTEELKKYDDQHGNSDLDHMYFRDVSSRQRKEREWTKATTVTGEYLDPAEFATVMAEQLDRTFYRESSIARDPERKWFGRTLPEHVVERAKKIVQSVSQAIENWHAVHESDGSFKKPAEAKLEERQTKLIDYLVSLMNSYQRGKESKRTDEEMIYTVRQMEVSLNFLGKFAAKEQN